MSMIQKLADELLQPDITVEQLIPSIGILSQRRGFGYLVTPRDKSISEVFIGADDMHLNMKTQAPTDIELTFLPENRPRLSDLPKAFGQWRRVPANPEGNPWSYSATYAPHGLQLQVTLFAELTGDTDNPSTRVQILSLRRDKW